MATLERRLEDLARVSDRELLRHFETGTRPDPARLAGWEFRGFCPPAFAKLAGIQKFKKGFFSKLDGDRKTFWGYNVPVIQDGLHRAWTNKHGETAPKRFGFFEVLPGSTEAALRHPNALLHDYGRGGNPFYDGTRFLRDYVVQVDPDNEDLYLGRAYLSIGRFVVPSNFFLLDRLCRTDFSG
jgi:hypothetical protein